MKIRDFEIKAAEFFLHTEEKLSAEAQLSIIETTKDTNLIADSIEGISVYTVFEEITVWDLLELIYSLSDEYKKFYNMKNERFHEPAE